MHNNMLKSYIKHNLTPWSLFLSRWGVQIVNNLLAASRAQWPLANQYEFSRPRRWNGATSLVWDRRAALQCARYFFISTCCGLFGFENPLGELVTCIHGLHSHSKIERVKNASFVNDIFVSMVQNYCTCFWCTNSNLTSWGDDKDCVRKKSMFLELCEKGLSVAVHSKGINRE